jgi:hypothetical protein
MRTLTALMYAVVLSGCSASITPSKLEPPAAVLMQPPKPLADPKEGEDLVQLHIDARRRFAMLADRHKRLQRWAKTVLEK